MNDSKSKIDNLISFISKNERKIHLYLITTIIILWISFAFDIINLKKIFAFSLFVIIGGTFKYFISRYHIFIELTPIAFFSIIIARYMGLIFVIPYIIAADVLPSYLGKYGPDHSSLPHWTWVFLISLIAMPLDVTNIFIRTMIPLIYFAGCLIIEQFVLGGLNPWKWSSSIGNLMINLYFFIKLTLVFTGMII